MSRPIISFLTDFGPDGAAAICRGVMIGIARDAQIIDISHAVRKYAVRDGAYLLWSAVPYLPSGVHVAVVDPGVGTERRPIGLLTARGDVLVGPDNGLLRPAAERLGGIESARVLENRNLMLPVTTATFHGRDLFAPVAGNLATGVAFEAVGPAVDPATLVDLRFPGAVVRGGALETVVVYVDSFGNLRLAGEPTDLHRALGTLEPGQRLAVEIAGAGGGRATLDAATFQPTFGHVAVGDPLVYVDSSGRLAYADNQGNAAARLGAEADRGVTIRAR